MKQFTLLFSFYGKKMQTTINARTEEEAKKEVVSKLIFYRVEAEKAKKSEIYNDIPQGFKDIFGW